MQSIKGDSVFNRYNNLNNSIMKDLTELKKNEHLISDLKTNDKGEQIRLVDGVEIKQIKEDTPEAIEKNRLINLWRMRNKPLVGLPVGYVSLRLPKPFTWF